MIKTIAAIVLGIPTLAAALPLDVEPSLLSPSDAPGWAGAARLKSAVRKEREFGRPDRFLSAEYEFRSTLSSRPTYNPEKTSLDIRTGIDWSWDRIASVEEFPGADVVRNTDVSPQHDHAWQWGTFSTQLAGGFEADEPFHNKQFTYGLRINYTPSAHGIRVQAFIPHVWLDYRRVNEVGSALAARLGLPRQDYWRFGSQVYWQLALSRWTEAPFVRELKVVPGFHYYRNTDYALALRGGDWADAFLSQCSIEYAVPQSLWLGRHVSRVTVSVSDGRIPPSMRNQTTFSISVAIK